MKTHYLQLATSPFSAIINGEKTIESRLFDEKRQLIQLNDKIIFTNREDPVQTVAVIVIGLLRYQNFHELFKRNNPKKFGGNNTKQLEDQINEFYSADEQQKHGVVGIEFELT